MTHPTLSKEGINELSIKLDALQEERRALSVALADARQVKDADEFDLVDEMTRLALLDKQISELRYLIAHSVPTAQELAHDDTVRLGSTVHLETPHGVLQCMVVSPLEANPDTGKISEVSPLGSALLGKAAQALVHVKGPKKDFTYRVLGVATT